MKIITKSLFYMILFANSAFADDSVAQFNTQIQSQLKQLQTQQQQQTQQMNTQLQGQIKKVQTDLQQQIQTMNTKIQDQIKTVQTQLQKQLQTVNDQVQQLAAQQNKQSAQPAPKK